MAPAVFNTISSSSKIPLLVKSWTNSIVKLSIAARHAVLYHFLNLIQINGFNTPKGTNNKIFSIPITVIPFFEKSVEKRCRFIPSLDPASLPDKVRYTT